MDTTNNMIAVINEIPVAKPSIPSIRLNILMMVNIHICVNINDKNGEIVGAIDFVNIIRRVMKFEEEERKQHYFQKSQEDSDDDLDDLSD